MSGRRSTWQVLAVPLLLALATLAGLVLALVGDGGWDMAADMLLALPLAALARHWRRAPQAAIVSSGSQSVATSA